MLFGTPLHTFPDHALASNGLMTFPATALPIEPLPAFLGVSRSLTGRLWRDRLDARGAAQALAIAQRHDLPELLARIVAGRRVDVDAVEDFLDPTVKRSMPDPHVLTDMPQAAARIAHAVEHGETIACVTPARHLIVAGVSNWGAYALLAALALLREDWRKQMLGCLDETLDAAVLEEMVIRGPAVDGVSRVRAMTVDNLEITIHHEKLREIRALAEAGDGV